MWKYLTPQKVWLHWYWYDNQVTIYSDKYTFIRYIKKYFSLLTRNKNFPSFTFKYTSPPLCFCTWFCIFPSRPFSLGCILYNTLFYTLDIRGVAFKGSQLGFYLPFNSQDHIGTGGHGGRVVTLASHLWGRGSIPVMALSGKAGSCLPLVGSLQYRSLTNCMQIPDELYVLVSSALPTTRRDVTCTALKAT